MVKNSTDNTARRNMVLDSLKRKGPQSAHDLAEQFDVTPMAVRLHLYDMEKEGLVASENRSVGRGRPLKIWNLTEDANRVFPDAHQTLAVDLIGTMNKLFGNQGLDKIIEAHGARQKSDYFSRLKDTTSLEDRVKALAKIRTDEGYMAEALQDASGWLLIENHCPICSAAKACAGLCKNELEIFQEIIGPDAIVTREDHILAGARRCTYRIIEL
ncbi:transcriptional regulator [Sneathiella marina]|uniref:Transcriptional regulator n=1 Tax=Sneathiella marina TaxID=2950108 RepID=A0ABY4W8F3_9PROT|nr:metalloregulator ArsR/SmtB family transcription factor [Sneathiella marina]USG62207.1 transcriptional regulator [Sneathiella marina]